MELSKIDGMLTQEETMKSGTCGGGKIMKDKRVNYIGLDNLI